MNTASGLASGAPISKCRSGDFAILDKMSADYRASLPSLIAAQNIHAPVVSGSDETPHRTTWASATSVLIKSVNSVFD
jgi:hypothetical protein